jgi:biopolymer transport protein ExbB/TolQ
MVDKIP